MLAINNLHVIHSHIDIQAEVFLNAYTLKLCMDTWRAILHTEYDLFIAASFNVISL